MTKMSKQISPKPLGLYACLGIFCLVAAYFGILWTVTPDYSRGEAERDDLPVQHAAVDLVSFTPETAIATFQFDANVLHELGWTVAATIESGPELEGIGGTLQILPGSEVLIETSRKRFTGGVFAQLRTVGGLMLGGGGRVLHIPNPTLRGDTTSGWSVQTILGGVDEPLVLFTMDDAFVQFGQTVEHMTLTGTLVMTADAAKHVGLPELAGRTLGLLHVELVLTHADAPTAASLAAESSIAALASTSGPDVIVGDLHAPSPSRRGVLGTISAYALGTTACNIGDMPIGWFAMTSDAPVITFNLYRLRNNQFEQIGLSWMKYGFAIGAGNLCNPQAPCVPLPTSELPPGCSDVYSINTNAFQNNFAPRHTVNPVTGVYTYSVPPPFTTSIERLLQVERNDLEPDLNAQARYFAESHYITPDDAGAHNQDNNASYREVFVVENPPNMYSLSYSSIPPNPPAISTTRREKTGVLAWQEADPTVTIVNIDVPGDRRFILGDRVIDLGGGQWQYEYALQNLNSDRAGQSFSVPLPDQVTVTNIGFHDIADHSGVPFDTTDWPFTLNPDSVVWATDAEGTNANANALRWGSLFNFRFTTDSPPQPGSVTLGLFKAGVPASVSASALVPDRRRLFAAGDPSDGAIDARQSVDLDGSAAAGFDAVELECYSTTICSALSVSDLTLTQTGGTGSAPTLLGLVPSAPDLVSVIFSGPITPLAWTTLATTSSGDLVRLGFLPGDVDAGGTSDAADATALAAELTAGPSLPVWSVDINRNSTVDAEDLIRLMDLLNGAGAYNPLLNVTLPPMPGG